MCYSPSKIVFSMCYYIRKFTIHRISVENPSKTLGISSKSQQKPRTRPPAVAYRNLDRCILNCRVAAACLRI